MRTYTIGCSTLALTLVAGFGGLCGEPDKEVKSDQVAGLIKQLGDNDFDKREVAGKKLEALGETALASLRKAATTSDDAEIRRRADQLVQTITERVAREAEVKVIGTWKLVKSRNGDEAWQDAPEGQRWQKNITRTHFTWTVITLNSNQVLHGAIGKCSIKGNTYVERVESPIGYTEKGLVGLEIAYTWQMKGRELHMVADFHRGTRVEQIWVPAD